jgi:hypothetical protein
VVRNDDDYRFMGLKEYCEREDKSLSTAKREFRAGIGPQVTQLSARRIGIRFDHYRAFCEQRIRARVAA